VDISPEHFPLAVVDQGVDDWGSCRGHQGREHQRGESKVDWKLSSDGPSLSLEILPRGHPKPTDPLLPSRILDTVDISPSRLCSNISTSVMQAPVRHLFSRETNYIRSYLSWLSHGNYTSA